MIVTETSADGLKREFKVVVQKEDIETRILGRLEEMKKTVNMRGFRPGKVPVSLLRKRFGGSVRGEILEEALSQTAAQALAEKGVRAVMQPKIAEVKFDEGEDLEYTMAVELMPDIAPKDFRDIKLKRQSAEVGDQDVDGAFERIAASHKNFVPVKRARRAKKGDALEIDFVGKIDGTAFEGGGATGHVIELGSNTFVEGFEDQLVGAKPGDHLEVKITFPENYASPELAGKDAVFEVDVKELKIAEPVAIDEAFAKQHDFDDLAAMRAQIKEQIERDFAAVSRAKLKRALLDVLSEDYDFPVPPGMLDIEFAAIWHGITQAKEQNRLDSSDVGRSDDELRADYRAIAERRVRLGLFLSEVGRLNNITVEPEEVNRAIMAQARARAGQEDKVIEYYRENPEALNEVRAPLLEDKVVDFILEMAEVTDEKVTAEELMYSPEDDAPAASAEDDAPAARTKKAAARVKKPAGKKKKPAGKKQSN